jgi:hypothetical protein
MSESVKELFVQYLQSPSPETFERLRRAAAASPQYNPYSDGLSRAGALVGEEKFQEALDLIESVMPCWIMNPGMHMLASFAHHKLGHEKEAECEAMFCRALIDGILATGDGSRARPYKVMYVRDEYDVLEHLGKKRNVQALVGDGVPMDEMTCEDGTVLWFDISAPMAALGRRENRAAPGRKWWQFWK